MAKTIDRVKQRLEDGTYVEAAFAVIAQNVKMANGNTLETEINNLTENIGGITLVNEANIEMIE